MKREPRTARERAILLLRAALAPGWLLPTSSSQRLVWAIRIAIVLGFLLLISSAVDKPLWSWLQLLIVPAVLAIGGYWFNRQQQNREFAIAEQRTQDEALQAYLDQMSQLLTDKGLRSKTHWLDDTRVTARARSLAALTRLDGERKRNLLQFLYEAQLINKEKKPLGDGTTEFEASIVGLSGADLRKANLRHITLEDAALNGAILEKANLKDGHLSNINLGGAYLSGADLRDAELSDASLVNADLRDAKLSNSDLGGAGLCGADLSNASLRGASLVNAELQRKDELNLNGADLSGADLSGADLSGANLYEVKGWTEEQLTAARSLEGATMPDGSKHP